MKRTHPEYMTTKKERLSYRTYFVGQNIYCNITAVFLSTYLALFLLGLFNWISVEAERFEQLEAMSIQHGLWIVYALVPVIGMIFSTFFYLGYKRNDKDVQSVAKCNSGEIIRAEAEKLLSRKY